MKNKYLLIILLIFSSCELFIYDFVNREINTTKNQSKNNVINNDSNDSLVNVNDKSIQDDNKKEKKSNKISSSESSYKIDWSNPAMGAYGTSVVKYIRAYFLVGEWNVIKKFLINADCISDEEFQYIMRNSEWGYEINLTNLHKKDDGSFIISYKNSKNNTVGMDQYYGKVINDTAKIYFHSQNKKNPFLYDSKYPSSDINCQLNNLSKKINFEFNKSNLKSDSKKTLEKIATLLISFPKIKLSINGHTSSEGSVKYNNELSYNRANSVLKFLKEFGLKNKMEVFGYGSSQQIYDELDKINNPKNRRVEIILL